MLATKPGREEVFSSTFRLDRLLKAERCFRDRSDPLALPEDILYERYRFSSEGIRYLIILVGPYVGNATKRSCALTVAQCVCFTAIFRIHICIQLVMPKI